MRAGRPLPVRAFLRERRVRARAAGDRPRRASNAPARDGRGDLARAPPGRAEIRAGRVARGAQAPASGRRSGEAGWRNRMRLAARSSRPPNGSTSRPPEDAPGQDDAIALTGKSRRREVFHDRYAGLNVRQRARPRIGLPPCRRDVEPSRLRAARESPSRIARGGSTRPSPDAPRAVRETGSRRPEGEVDVPDRIFRGAGPGRRRRRGKSSSPRSPRQGAAAVRAARTARGSDASGGSAGPRRRTRPTPPPPGPGSRSSGAATERCASNRRP